MNRSLAAVAALAVASPARAAARTAGDLFSAKDEVSRLVILHAETLLTSFEPMSARRLEAFRPLDRRELTMPHRIREVATALRDIRLTATTDQIDARWLLVAYDHHDVRLATIAIDAGANELESGGRAYLVGSPRRLTSVLHDLMR